MMECTDATGLFLSIVLLIARANLTGYFIIIDPTRIE